MTNTQCDTLFQGMLDAGTPEDHAGVLVLAIRFALEHPTFTLQFGETMRENLVNFVNEMTEI